MNNIVFLSPNSLQFTYENTDLQKNVFSFFSTSNLKYQDLLYPFFEKYVTGFQSLLNTIQPQDIIYFTLTPSLNFEDTKQFVSDLVLASQYNKATCIVYDYTKCASINCEEAAHQCAQLKKILEECKLPVVYLDNTYTVKFNTINLVQTIDLKKLNQIVKYVHHIFDLKSEVSKAVECLQTSILLKKAPSNLEMGLFQFYLN